MAKQLLSLANFKKSISETDTLIRALDVQIITTKEFLKFTKAEKNPDFKKMKLLFKINENQNSKLWELGFICLFSNFECFMFELLKELYKNYPDSQNLDKTVKFDDLRNLTSIEEVKEFFVDSLAIEKSYTIEVWHETIKNLFGMNVFENNKELEYFKLLSSLRNISMHSGGKTTSKFSKEVSKILNVKVPVGDTHSLDMKKMFIALYNLLNKLAANIQSKDGENLVKSKIK